MSALMVVLCAVLVAALVVVAARPILRSLPAPQDHPGKLPWAHLPTARWLLGVGLASAISSGLVCWLVPLAALPLWLVWTGPVTLLIGIDAATTWLPLRLTQACWALCLLAVGVGLSLGLDWSGLSTSLAGAAACTALLWGLWWLARGQLGFGDVRLAPMLGLCTGALGLQYTLWGLFLGSLVGVALGLIHQLRQRPGGFAYAPALWAGPILCLALGAVAR